MEMNPASANILPEGFDGVFRFTNASDEEFSAKWNSVEYIFPPKSMVPLIIMGEPPEGVQNIRRKFAKEFGIREFMKTDKFKYMNATERGEKPALYTDADLAPYIQSCLDPLPLATPVAKVVKETHEEVFSTDEEGNPRTKVLKSKLSDPKHGNSTDDTLVGNGAVIA